MPGAEIAQRLAEHFLAGNAPGQSELTAYLGPRVEQGHLVTALGQGRRRRFR